MHLIDSKYSFRYYCGEILIFYTLVFQTISMELHSTVLVFTLESLFRRKSPLNYIKWPVCIPCGCVHICSSVGLFKGEKL